jgi:hypothetical protein
MQFLTGALLHKKQFTTKQGKQIPVISILDEYEKFSQVVDITDFDNFAASMDVGATIQIPIRVKAVVSEKGNPYLNYVTAGAAKVA